MAAPYIAGPVTVLNRYIPKAAKMVDINNNTCGGKSFNTGLANARPITITPVSRVNIKIALSVTFFNNTSIHCPVNNSVIAVPNMQMNMKINNGFQSALYIPEVETPDDTRSVTGKSNFENR